MEPDLNKQQEDALFETMSQGVAFEEMVRSKGWEYIKAYYQVQVQAFATGLLVSEEPIERFENKRQELIGLRKLLSVVDSAIETLVKHREHERTTRPATE